MTRPRTIIDSHSTATASIPELEADIRKLLAVLDKLIYNFEDDDPEFVSNYWNARIIVSRGIRHEKPKDDGKKGEDEAPKG